METALDPTRLLDLAIHVAQTLDPTTVINDLLEGACTFAHADRATLSSITPEGLTIEASVSGQGSVEWIGRHYATDYIRRQPLVAEMLDSGEVVLGGSVDVTTADPQFTEPLSNVRHTAVIPIVDGDAVTAMVVLSRLAESPFHAEDSQLLKAFGALAGLALRNARLVDRIRSDARRKQEFLDDVVHELKSPLAVIVGYADILRDPTDLAPVEVQRIAGIVARKAAEAIDMTTDMLTLARVESGALTVAAAPVPIPDLLADVVARARPRASLANGTIAWESPSGIVACADIALLTRVIDNLVSNALTYVDGAPSIHLSARRDAGRVLVSVHDNGLGIQPDERASIFERYVRGGSSTGHPGTGLGLYLGRECARLMGGDLVLEPSQSTGSTFTVSLPTP